MFEFSNIMVSDLDNIEVSEDNEKICFDDSFNELELSDTKRLSDPIFKSIGYPSKIYYKNIQEFIRRYSRKGATVLDSCCGSGSTGIAGVLEDRKVLLADNSPEAINITFNMLNYLDLKVVKREYKNLIDEISDFINGLYEVKMEDGTLGHAQYIICSNTYKCPKCENDIILYGRETGKRSEYKCDCGYLFNISKHEDKKHLKDRRVPVEANVEYIDESGRVKKAKKKLTLEDIQYFDKKCLSYEDKCNNMWKPDEKIVYNRCYPRPGGWPGFSIDASVSELYTKTNILALQILNDYIEKNIKDLNIKAFFKFIFTECLFRTSNRLFTTSGLKNVYQVPALGKVQNVLVVFKRKYKSILKAKKALQDKISKETIDNNVRILHANAKALPIRDNCVDYAFIDPPYGGVVPYAELNLFYSAWLGEKEDLENEIIIPMDYDKKENYVEIWGKQVEEAFREVKRVLKPGAYFTIVFQSRFSSIWNTLRDIMNRRLGFEFVNIVKNDRGTTFHTNHTYDTNPESAFITYRKAERVVENSFNLIRKNIFDIFPKNELLVPKTLREIQSNVIFWVHREGLSYVPDDKEIVEWLNLVCDKEGDKYKLKE